MALVLPSRTWPERRQWRAAYYVAIWVAASVILVTQLRPTLAQVVAHPDLLLMAGLGISAGLLAFVEKAPAGRAATVISPTVCFTFAVLLCWGLGPALIMQILATSLVA